ncbi:MAG TPA: ferritin-like domain-containing protein [Polyangiaceae bacterium]|nr:ferritin-like domain-containing protein [Polyangiaceae bacterium]
MHSHSLRLALFTSLGLIPLGCAEGASVPEGNTTDVLSPQRDRGPPGSDPHPVAPLQRAMLAACGQSVPVTADALGGSIGGRSPTLTPGVFTGIERCENGLLHRPEPVTCSVGLPRPLPPGAADAGALDGGGSNAGDSNLATDSGPLSQVEYLYGAQDGTGGGAFGAYPYPTCKADAECTERPYGYCAPSYQGGPYGYDVVCQYGCVQDSDCGAGFLCECGDPVGHCVQAECQSDADCDGDNKCAAWFSPVICTGDQGYSCQAREDECNSSLDCAAGSACLNENGKRECVERTPGACGRPFLVAGVARLAGLRPGADWSGSVELDPAPGALTDAERAHAGAHWAHSALLEHASIAAFARFTLQLLQLGAPRELVQRSQQALLDETAHAELCFALAARYLPAPVEPGCLPLEGALAEQDLAQIAVLTFREGCVGETVAVLEASEAREQALDPQVQAALDRIAPDELRHAELAWRFVSWALQQDASVRPLLLDEVARLEAELRTPLLADETPELPVHGVLSARRRESVRRAALAEVVLPCARRVLRAPGAPSAVAA